jgi:hypothetical protein
MASDFPVAGPKMTESARNFVWLAVLFIVAPVFAAITFYDLYNHDDALAKWEGRAWFFLLAITPVLWGVALGMRRPLWLALVIVHAALISAFLLVNIAFRPDGSGPAIVGFGFFLAILGVDAFIARIASVRMKESRRDISHPKFVYLGLTASIFGGCFVGVQLWSPTLPPRIIAVAETTAADRPYCIEVDGRPARNAGELTGLKMAPRGGFTLNFRALLVIDTSRPPAVEQIHRFGRAPLGEEILADRIYLNWSYRSGRFEPVSQYAREGLHLDYQVKCTPVAHFARNWV